VWVPSGGGNWFSADIAEGHTATLCGYRAVGEIGFQLILQKVTQPHCVGTERWGEISVQLILQKVTQHCVVIERWWNLVFS